MIKIIKMVCRGNSDKLPGNALIMTEDCEHRFRVEICFISELIPSWVWILTRTFTSSMVPELHLISLIFGFFIHKEDTVTELHPRAVRITWDVTYKRHCTVQICKLYDPKRDQSIGKAHRWVVHNYNPSWWCVDEIS